VATTKAIKIGAAVVGGLIAVAVAFMVGNSSVDSPKRPAASQATATTLPQSPAISASLVEFRDDKVGWTIAYPRAWNRLEAKDTDVALVVSEKPVEQNSGGSILARNLALGAPVDDTNLAAAKEVTDRIVSGDGVEHITQPQVLHQAGLPGYFYFYRFKDSASGQVGVHSHYFLFKGSTMISFVFQALPDADFQRLATLYDQVIASFRAL
jgi:hypothetical protein